jgi:NO-binding membrane sensor protein with MHYT domain
MKNPAIFYAALVIGIVALAIGIYYQVNGAHPARAIAGLAVGAVLLIVGIVGMFMARSKAVAK